MLIKLNHKRGIVKKEIIFNRLAEEVKFWREEFNKAMNELETFDKTKRFRVEKQSVEEIIRRAHEVIE